MTKRKIMLLGVLCFLIALLAARALPQTGRSEGSPRLRTKTQAASRPELERKQKESQKATDRLAQRAKTQRQEQQKRMQEAKAEFLSEKRALAISGLTEEQWKLVKPKLEEMRKLEDLCYIERSTSGMSLGGSSVGGTGSKPGNRPSEPRWEWDRQWKAKNPAELSEGQKIAEQLIKLLDKKSARSEEFRQAMAALRKARSAEQPEIERRERNLSEAREKLSEGLTARQEATLVLMGHL